MPGGGQDKMAATSLRAVTLGKRIEVRFDGRNDQTACWLGGRALRLLGARGVHVIFVLRFRSLADLGGGHAKQRSAAARRSRLRGIHRTPGGQASAGARCRLDSSRSRSPCRRSRRSGEHRCRRSERAGGSRRRQCLRAGRAGGRTPARQSSGGARGLVLGCDSFAHSQIRIDASLMTARQFAASSSYRVATRRHCWILLKNRSTGWRLRHRYGLKQIRSLRLVWAECLPMLLADGQAP